MWDNFSRRSKIRGCVRYDEIQDADVSTASDFGKEILDCIFTEAYSL